MIQLSGFIRKQGQFLLENKWHALAHAIVLALLPYTAWLSVAIIALVTLRRGGRDGGWLLIPVIIAHFALLLASTSPMISIVNTLLTFMPCYLAALVLRHTASWSAVAWYFFLQVIVIVLSLHVFMPDFIMAQYHYLQSVLHEMQADNALVALVHDNPGLNQQILASYLLGLQAIGVILSAISSLMLARSLQSQLFNPGGFRQEMLAFRGDKIGLLLLVVMVIAVRQQNMIAISILPTLMFYFLLAGLSLAFAVLAKQRPLSSIVLLGATLVLLPFIMLPVYVIFGSLDSLFNFRLYLPSRTGKPI